MDIKEQLLLDLSKSKTHEEFDSVLDKIEEKRYVIVRKRNDIFNINVSISDIYGRYYGYRLGFDPFKNPYKGIIGDDAYLDYIVNDGYHVGRMKLRTCYKYLRLEDAEGFL